MGVSPSDKLHMQTSNTVKAIKKTIKVAGLDVDVFQMPDGSYQYSQTSVAKAIGKAENSFLQFSFLWSI